MYKTLKPIYLNGTWHAAGAEVPADVAGYDYEKAARKGMLEAPEDGEIRNVPRQQEPAAQVVTQVEGVDSETLTAQVRAELEKQFEASASKSKKTVEDLTATVTELRGQLQTAQQERDAARKSLADGKLIPEDLQARLESVSGIGEDLAKKAVAAITAKKSPAASDKA